MDNEPKRGDVREGGRVCWGYTWKDKDGNKRYQWLTPERFAEKMANDKERLVKYAAENTEAIRLKQAEKYEKSKEYYKAKSNENHAKNRERNNKRNSEYQRKNAEILKQKHNEYRANNRERARRWQKRYSTANHSKIIDKLRERRRNDPITRLKDAIRGSIRAYLGSKKTRRSATFEIVGCTPDFLRSHLEKQFNPGMTWENYGSHWHVDHRIPLASGNSPEEIMGLSHWTNLQPLEALENLLKSDKMPLAIDASSSQPIDRIIS
jgi:hypothetical protein